MHRVACQLRVGDMALHALHQEMTAERAAPAVLYRIAEAFDAGRFADDAEVDAFAARFEHLDHMRGAMNRIAFFIRGE